MTTAEKLIKSKMNLLDLAAYLKNVSEARRVMGYSRDTFYRVKKAYENGGMEALKEKSRRTPNIKNRVSEEVEQAVVAFALSGAGVRAETGGGDPPSARPVHLTGWSALCVAPAWIGDVRQAATTAGGARCQDRW